jgi:hypothetical protein
MKKEALNRKAPFSAISPLLSSGLLPENFPLRFLFFMAFFHLFGQGLDLG